MAASTQAFHQTSGTIFKKEESKLWNYFWLQDRKISIEFWDFCHHNIPNGYCKQIDKTWQNSKDFKQKQGCTIFFDRNYHPLLQQTLNPLLKWTNINEWPSLAKFLYKSHVRSLQNLGKGLSIFFLFRRVFDIYADTYSSCHHIQQ